jgi:hypothetical protein
MGQDLWNGSAQSIFSAAVRALGISAFSVRLRHSTAALKILTSGDSPSMWLINTTVLGGPRRLLRWRERDQGCAEEHENCHTYQFST